LDVREILNTFLFFNRRVSPRQPALLIAHCVCAGALFAQTPKPDLVLHDAVVITMNPNEPIAQAVAIRGDRIFWVGSENDSRRLFGDAPQSDLHGATLVPGIIDAHTHLLALGQSLLKLNLKDAASPEEVVVRVRQKVATTSADVWIQGWGWDEGKWASHYPSNNELSLASPRNPVFLVGLHGFAAWANRRALELAGIHKETKDPENGKIVRDEKSGEPTGILLNHAQDLVVKYIPQITLDQGKKALETAAQECVRNGLTSLHEAQVTPLMLDAYGELIREGRMPLRLYAMLDGSNKSLVEDWLKRGPQIDPAHQLTIRAFKLFADGALGSRGASLLEPYADAPQIQGVVTTSGSDVYNLTHLALAHGFQVCTHAIGDAANRSVLDAYEHALRDSPNPRNSRLRIEHAQILAPEDIPRFARLGVIASMQPVHCTSDMPWAENRLGPERVKGAYAWRSIVDSGAHVPFSSDFPGETLNPFYGIYAAITRQDPNGNPPGGWHPEQRVSLQQALRGYTMEAAYAGFEENIKGSIENGKLADLTVIDKDITKLAPREILSIQVLKTFVGGKLVFESKKNPVSTSSTGETGKHAL
jgi:predicted amidohydrolase YtcJ